MADNQTRVETPDAAVTAEQAPKGGFLPSIIEIFTDPLRVFARIDAGLTWWKPFILVCAAALVVGYFMLPFQQRLIELNQRGLSEEQLQKAVEGFGKFAPATLIMIPIMLIIVYLVVAGILHLVINIMSSRSSFKKTLSLVSFCGIITIVEQIIGAVILKTRGVESIESPEDLKFSLSLAPLVGEGKGLLHAILQSLSIFEIWYYVVLVLGIAAIFRISRKQAVVPVLPIWIFSVIMLLVGGKFTGGAR
ncbi:MAG: Yip1 family protein [Candidatus Krumholzibacteria bacterium]|nr:Yip1 family protein [Candidatus Krumholzibacteria bacterium]